MNHEWRFYNDCWPKQIPSLVIKYRNYRDQFTVKYSFKPWFRYFWRGSKVGSLFFGGRNYLPGHPLLWECYRISTTIDWMLISSMLFSNILSGCSQLIHCPVPICIPTVRETCPVIKRNKMTAVRDKTDVMNQYETSAGGLIKKNREISYNSCTCGLCD